MAQVMQYPDEVKFASALPVFLGILNGSSTTADDVNALWVVAGFAASRVFPPANPAMLGQAGKSAGPYTHAELASQLGGAYNLVNWAAVLQAVLAVIMAFMGK